MPGRVTAEEPPNPRLNDVGDVILEDARQLRALADPGRLASFEWLQRHGPATPQDVAAAIGLPGDVVAGGLERLAAAGLVRSEGAAWRAFGRGIFLPAGADDAERRAATRALGVVMLRAAADRPGRWLDEVEPRLDPAWAAAAGLFNAGVELTPAEVEDVQAGLERVLEPYLNRAASDRPTDARKVRILGFFLPESGATEG